MTSFIAELKDNCKERWEEVTSHPLTKDWNRGNLSTDIQYVYIEQDTRYSVSFLALLKKAIELSKSYNDGATKILENQWDFIMADEDPYFTESLVILDRKINDKTKIDGFKKLQLKSVNRYLEFLNGKTAKADYVEIMLILFVMEEIYLDWGKKFLSVQEKLGDWLYDEWMVLHSGPAFTEWCKFLAEEVNSKVEDSNKENLRKVFNDTVNFEFSFFDECYSIDI